MSFEQITPDVAAERLEAGGAVLLDVRTMPEWTALRVPGAVHIPMDELPQRYQELDPEAETLVLCAHGVRSAACADWLVRVGFERVANVRNGISAWSGRLEHG